MASDSVPFLRRCARPAGVALALACVALSGCDRNDPARPEAKAAARATEDALKHAASAAQTETQEALAKARASKALEKTDQAIDAAGDRAKAALDAAADRTHHSGASSDTGSETTQH